MDAALDKAVTGRRNKLTGQMFEQMIEASCHVYRQKGIASIEKTPEPTKFIRTLANGRFVACYEKKAQPDFKGVLNDGSCIVFDAKHTDSDRIQQGAVSEEQEEFMDTYEKLGAHCYVVVSMAFRYFFRVPWGVWKGMKKAYGHKYMAKADLWPYRIPDRTFIAFLEGIEIRAEEPGEGE